MSIKDRDQKESVLQFCLSRGWFPHVEVDVYPTRQVSRRGSAQTDIDLLALVPAAFGGFDKHLFDCKTKAKESPINRVLWLHGLMRQLDVTSGTCVLKKDSIEVDHRLSAFDLGISLVAEAELTDWAKGLGGAAFAATTPFSLAGNFAAWEELLTADRRNPQLSKAVQFIRSGYWQIRDEAEAARKCIFLLKSVRGEIDPAKPEQLALALYLAALFSVASASLASRLFSIFVLPKSQDVYEEALRVSLYGGRDAYEQRNALYTLLAKARGHDDVEALGVPGWEHFAKLIRQMMEAPIQAAHTPHILQELAFAALASNPVTSSQRALMLSVENQRSAQYALNLCGYLFKATKIPPEIGEYAAAEILALITVAVSKK